MAAQMLAWTGPRGGQIDVGFDDWHFGPEQMRTEIDFARQAHPYLPDEVPPGTIFAFGKEGTGHLKARFRVGTTVYRSGGQRDLRRLWETVGLIDRVLHPERHKIAS